MSGIEIAILVLIVFGLLFFLGIIFILLKNHNYKVKYDFLKKRFNQLIQYDFEKLIIPIDHISYSHSKYECFSDFFSIFIESYRNEMDDIKDYLYKMSDALKNYDWVGFNKMHIFISKRLSNVNNSLDEAMNVYNDILDYRNYASTISVAYREKTFNIIDFYEKNLASFFNNDEMIENGIKQLKEYINELNLYIEKKSFYKMVKTLKDFNTCYTSIFNIILNLYLRSKQFLYIDYNYEEISKFLKTNSNIVDNLKRNDVDKSVAKIAHNIANIHKKINKCEFEKIDNLFIDTVKLIINVKEQLNLNFKSNEFMAENKEYIFKRLSQFQNEIKEIHFILNKISANFYSDNKIREIVDQLKQKLNVLKHSLDILFGDSKANKLSNADIYLKTKNIISNIITWLNDFNDLIIDVKNKYDYFKEIVNEITNAKILLAQMTTFINDNNKKETNLLTYLKYIRKHSIELNEIEKSFLHNYDKNFNKNYSELLKIKHSINELNLIISSVYCTKKYVEKLIKYANILMINEGVEFEFDNVLSFYEQGNYIESLSIIINQLKPYKYNNERKLFNNKF